MQVEIKIDSAYTEPKLILMTASVTEEVSHLLKKLSEDVPRIISGSRDDKIEVLEQEDLIRIYADAGKIVAVTEKGEYALRLRLYELEERFAGEGFVRASKAVVINLDRLRSLRPDFGGRLILTMDNGEKLFASRQYAGYVKKRLGI